MTPDAHDPRKADYAPAAIHPSRRSAHLLSGLPLRATSAGRVSDR